MTQNKDIYDPPFLDEEERELIEAFDAHLEAGALQAPVATDREAINVRWQEILKESQERRAVTLRLQQRDITRLKSIARRRGIPYQTLVSSILHQFANGDIIERP